MGAQSTDSAIAFKTLSPIDFSFSSSVDPTTVTVYSVDDNGSPIYYLIKKSWILSILPCNNSFSSFSNFRKGVPTSLYLPAINLS